MRVQLHVPTLSPSQIESWSSCRLKWYWQYPMGYHPRAVNIALQLGEAVHAALEAWYGFGVEPYAFFHRWCDMHEAEDPNAWLEIRALGGSLEDYVDYYKDEPFRVVAIERTLQSPLPNLDTGGDTDCMIVARLDGIAQDDECRVWALEHKTFSQFRPEEIVQSDQFACQVWLLQQHEEAAAAGVIYNGIRKTTARNPRAPIFERHWIPVNRQKIDFFLLRAYSIWKQMRDDAVAIYPEPGRLCSSCDFEAPCNALQSGEDYEALLGLGFTRREDRPGSRETKQKAFFDCLASLK